MVNDASRAQRMANSRKRDEMVNEASREVMR